MGVADQDVAVTGTGPDGPESGRRDITSTPWPWMASEGTRGTPIRDRRRKRGRGGFISSLLARVFGPPAGNHHAPPGAPAEDPPPPPPSWDSDCSPGAVTLMDFTYVRVPRYIRQGGQHRA